MFSIYSSATGRSVPRPGRNHRVLCSIRQTPTLVPLDVLLLSNTATLPVEPSLGMVALRALAGAFPFSYLVNGPLSELLSLLFLVRKLLLISLREIAAALSTHLAKFLRV